MSTSPEIPCIAERNEATMLDHERFIDRHRLVLLQWNKKASRRKSYNRRQAILSLR
jgi:hypothetical protein